MFDIGFSELILLAVVALVVVGPKRLPVATRTFGTLMGRAQRYVSDVKSDIQRQMDLEELRKVKEQVQSVGDQIQSGMQSVEKEVGGVTQNFEDFGNDVFTLTPEKRGTHISLPEPSWTEQMAQRRVREKLRNRMRRRFLKKRPRDE